MSQGKLESAKNLLFIALAIDIAVTALVAITDFWAVGVFNDIRAGVTEADQSTIRSLEFWESFSKVMILTVIGVGLALVRWLDACYGYAKEALRATGFVQEGWKTWGWIVPFMNLFKPYQVLSEIYRVGATDYRGGGDWKKSSGSGTLLAWWIFWILAHMAIIVISGIGQQTLRSSTKDAPTLAQITGMYYGSATVCVISLIVAGLWFVVAGNVTQRLLNRSIQIAGSGGSLQFPASNVAVPPVASNFTKAVLPEAPQPSPPQPIVGDDRIYEEIAKELETGATDKGLWTRLFAESGGDERLTKVSYIKQRAERLIAMERTRLVQLENERTTNAKELERLRRERDGLADPELLRAVLDGNWNVAKKLLSDGVQPFGADNHGNSLLDLAGKRRDRQMVQLLESYGAH